MQLKNFHNEAEDKVGLSEPRLNAILLVKQDINIEWPSHGIIFRRNCTGHTVMPRDSGDITRSGPT